MGYVLPLAAITIFLVIHHSCQFILQPEESGRGAGTGNKRPAWMPQGRMGKRDGELTNDEELEAGEGTGTGLELLATKKAAWVPQSRFGKRAGASLFEEGALGRGTSLQDANGRILLEDKRIPRMGLFERRAGDMFPRMGLMKKAALYGGYLTSGGKGEERSGLKGLAATDDLEGLFSEGGHHKRAAWVPQGRFGKRSLEGLLAMHNAVDGMLDGPVTKVTRDPHDPEVRCLSVRNGGQSSVLCLRVNRESGEIELLP